MRVSVLLAILLSPTFSHATTLNLLEGTLSMQGSFFLLFQFSGIDTATGVHYVGGGAADALVFPEPGAFIDGQTVLQYSATTVADTKFLGNDHEVALVQAGLNPGASALADYANLSFRGSVPLPAVFPNGPFTVTGPGFFSGTVTRTDFSLPTLPRTTYFFSAPTLTTVSINSFEGQHSFGSASAILTPEPATWALFISGLVALLLWRWRHSISLLVLIGLLLSPTLSHATPFSTSITITGGMALLNAGTLQVSFSGINTAGNIYTVGAFECCGLSGKSAPPGGIIQYAAHVGPSFVTVNRTETFFPIGDGAWQYNRRGASTWVARLKSRRFLRR